MHTSTWWFWGWFALLGVAPAVLVGAAWRPWMRLPATLYPWLLGVLLWLHGVWFDVPNNFATMDRLGLVGFWFHPARTYDLQRVGVFPYLLLSTPALLVTPLALVALRRCHHAVRGLAGSIPLLAFAMLILRGIPDDLVDILLHRGGLRRPELILEDGLPGAALRLAIAAIPLVVGLGLWLATTRPPATD